MRGGFSRKLCGPPGALPTALLLASVACFLTVPVAALAADGADSFKPDGTWWDPWGDPYSRSVFENFEWHAVPHHTPLDHESISSTQRPPGFATFAVLGAVLAPLALVIAAILRRRRILAFLKAQRPAWPDDLAWMLPIMACAFGLRLTATFLLPLHGSEWGSIELTHFRSLSDVVFNGYEVLTNPPLLNLIEHFVFRLSISPLAFRLPVVLFGMALIWGARCAGRELFSRRAGIIAAAFCSANCGLIVWSATMRAYLPMMTFIVAALPAAYRIASGRGRDRDVLKLAMFGALAAWTHYIALMWLAGMYVLILFGRRRDLRGIASAMAAGAWTMAAFLPLMPFLLSDMGSKQSSMMPPGYLMDLLAISTGLPAGLGFLVACGLLAARFYRSEGALWLSLLVGEYVLASLATLGIIHWEAPYSVGLAAIVMILAAGAVDSLPRAAAASVVTVAVLLSTSALLLAQPSRSTAVADAAWPFLRRSVSNRMFAREIRMHPVPGGTAEAGTVVLVTPAYESEPYLYKLGPVTVEQAGVEPIVLRNFDEMTFTSKARDGVPARRYTVIGFERYWDWRLGQWPELARFKERFKTFWYARLQQNCRNGTGFTWSSWDCRWLRKYCRLVESTANDELYLCGDEAP